MAGGNFFRLFQPFFKKRVAFHWVGFREVHSGISPHPVKNNALFFIALYFFRIRFPLPPHRSIIIPAMEIPHSVSHSSLCESSPASGSLYARGI